MSKKAVMVQVEVHCAVSGMAPIYRAFLDHELFTERTWLFDVNQYLEETWQIKAKPGRYKLRYDLIGNGSLTVNHWQVLRGSASIDDQGHLVIHDA